MSRHKPFRVGLQKSPWTVSTHGSTEIEALITAGDKFVLIPSVSALSIHPSSHGCPPEWTYGQIGGLCDVCYGFCSESSSTAAGRVFLWVMGHV